MKKIFVGSDHAGLSLKLELVQFLEAEGHTVEDLGTHTEDSVDYPDFGRAVAEAVADVESNDSNDGPNFGLCVCGSGLGISIAANRVKGVRAAVVYDKETAKLAREHNDANVICFGGRLISPSLAKECLKIFLETDFEGGRHIPRIEKLG